MHLADALALLCALAAYALRQVLEPERMRNDDRKSAVCGLTMRKLNFCRPTENRAALARGRQRERLFFASDPLPAPRASTERPRSRRAKWARGKETTAGGAPPPLLWLSLAASGGAAGLPPRARYRASRAFSPSTGRSCPAQVGWAASPSRKRARAPRSVSRVEQQVRGPREQIPPARTLGGSSETL